jgi:hypothetical protein
LAVYLLDADVIIWCAKHKKLDSLFRKETIKIPKIIYSQIKYRIDIETGKKEQIDLNGYIKNGKLKVINNPIDENISKIIEEVKNCPELLEIHHGEIECIYLLRENKNHKFCTGDKVAIKVLGFLHLSEQAISLEEIIGTNKGLRENFTQQALKDNLNIGSQLYVQYGNWK